MKKLYQNSRMEIWNSRYIAIPENRQPEDQNVTILQIEYTGHLDNYIVEVSEDPDPEHLRSFYL